MIITNKYNLPDVLVRALEKDYYSKNTKYSVTQILKSVQQVILEKRYYSQIKQDITERLWSFLGSAIHDFLEKGENEHSLIEERLVYKDILSGKFDYFDTEKKILYDYKITSVWKIIYNNDNFKDFRIQLSIYAYLLRKIGFEVNKIANVFILRDWKESEYKQGKYELDKSILCLEYDILEEIDGLGIEQFLDNKIEELEKNQDVLDEDLPECSLEYRWATEGVYKIYWNESKAKIPISVKNFSENNKESALKYLDWINEENKDKKTYRLEFFKGNQFKRCEYCSVKDFCQQHKKSFVNT